MATQAQTLANRTNAQASTGPRTPEGKLISRGNATKHGLAAAFRVLPNENQQEFDKLIAEYNRTFAPANIHERFLVEEMAQSRWRLARIRRLENEVVEQMVGSASPVDADSIIAAALLNNKAGALTVLHRYAVAAERSGHRAFQQLLALRKQRVQNEPIRPPQAAKSRISATNTNPAVPPGPFEQLMSEITRPPERLSAVGCR